MKYSNSISAHRLACVIKSIVCRSRYHRREVAGSRILDVNISHEQEALSSNGASPERERKRELRK